uniref:Ankyrin repeat protein n=1 Tax=Marseillevirus LCMAC103 TaxID=2506604 RepID=A0A481YVM7_9VIRU|nr:MAG: hypothetical protein LCMAC103_02990 [Marseillevirus LCMAC103]
MRFDFLALGEDVFREILLFLHVTDVHEPWLFARRCRLPLGVEWLALTVGEIRSKARLSLLARRLQLATEGDVSRALWWASVGGNLQAVQWLCAAHGLTPAHFDRETQKKRGLGVPGLSDAAENGQLDVVKWLIAEHGVAMPSPFTSFHVIRRAYANDHVETGSWLTRHVMRETGAEKMLHFAIELACMGGDAETVEWLVSAFGASADDAMAAFVCAMDSERKVYLAGDFSRTRLRTPASRATLGAVMRLLSRIARKGGPTGTERVTTVFKDIRPTADYGAVERACLCGDAAAVEEVAAKAFATDALTAYREVLKRKLDPTPVLRLLECIARRHCAKPAV